ncbi:MAG: hypothetical protein R3B06_32755 [Kofleriaceae bacterium]
MMTRAVIVLVLAAWSGACGTERLDRGRRVEPATESGVVLPAAPRTVGAGSAAVPTDGIRFTAVAVGVEHGCALDLDGLLYC